MKKNVWKNIFNFDSDTVTENNLNDIVSPISESRNISKKNIQELSDTSDINEVEEVPLMMNYQYGGNESNSLLMNYQSGGNVDDNKSINQINTNNYDNIDTEELENKLREIFSGLDEKHLVSQQGGRSKKSKKKDVCKKTAKSHCDKEKPTKSKNINIPLEYFNL